jgi:signal transduction histidine kinase
VIEGRRHPFGTSLRLRLALWYGGLTFAVVVLICIYSFAVHSRAHYDELDATLAAAADHVAQEVEAARTAGQLENVLEASLHLGAIMRIYGENEEIELRSSGDSAAPSLHRAELQAPVSRPAYPLVASFVPEMQHIAVGRGHFDVISGAERWRYYVVDIADSGRKLAAFLPLAHIDGSVRRFGWLMALLALVGGIASFGFGFLVAGRALSPVALLTDAAGDIARTREFSRRVGIGTSHDELGRLASTFNDMLASLEQAYTAQKRFVSDASHELRAPLTVIQANIELLRSHRAGTPADRQQAVEEAYREANRLSRLVSDLLVLARADSGVELLRAPVELDRIVMDVMGEARHIGNGQKFEIGTVEPCTLRGDPDRLRQLVLNLITNAVKYTPPGGRVRINLSRTGQAAVLTVSDTGIGISPEDLPRVFERFYRADAARTGDPGGTGLGLPIARWIARQHGGDVTLTSSVAVGTTATVQLPRG